MKALAAIFLTLFAVSAFAQDQSFVIGEIEFYGYSGLQLNQIRAALPIHEGDTITIKDSAAAKEKIRKSVESKLGRPATEVSFTCCNHQGNLLIYIGLPNDLIEMARWRDPNHASDARMILGRIAGIEKSRLAQIVGSGNVDKIINAVRSGK